jgi:thiamine pyrophosphate-dependent acetolactate synthase large subunit-like protein
MPVYLSGMARGLLGRAHPLQMRHARRQALREADCVMLAGVPCDFRLDYGRHVRRNATLIAANRSRQATRDSTAAPVWRPSAMRASSSRRWRSRTPRAATWDTWAQCLRQRDEAREAEIANQAAARGAHVNPLALLREIDRQADERAVFVADGGDFVATASYVLRPRAPLGWLDPGAFGTLGVGAGFAMGAALAGSGSAPPEVWILYGDGACGWGLAEFDSYVRQGIAVIAVVGNDAGWTQIAREQVKMLHDDVGTVLARSDYHAVAAAFGAEGLLVRRDDEVPAALQRARELARQGRPVLVNVWLDRTDFREGSLSM